MTHATCNRIRFRALRAALVFSLVAPVLAAAGGDDPIRTTPLGDREFGTEIEAVEAMRAQFLAQSIRDDAEHVGAILLAANGKYRVTHGQAGPAQIQVTFTVLRPPTARLMALWHTHGAEGGRAESFSIQDNDTVRDTGLPFYLIAPSGRLSLLVDADKGPSRELLNSVDHKRLEKVRGYPGLTLFRVAREP
jgi:hypothetical protein